MLRTFAQVRMCESCVVHLCTFCYNHVRNAAFSTNYVYLYLASKG